MYWREWLQTLLSLVILLGILEMLLPSGELAKFSKLVLGLALMLAVLQPLTLLLDGDLGTLDLSWMSTSSQQPEIQTLAERIQLAAAGPLLKRDEAVWATQIEDVLLNLVEIREVKVQIENEGSSNARVQVLLRPCERDTATRARQIVASLLNVAEGQISVQHWPE